MFLEVKKKEPKAKEKWFTDKMNVFKVVIDEENPQLIKCEETRAFSLEEDRELFYMYLAINEE